jgi:hypothetical protein
LNLQPCVHQGPVGMHGCSMTSLHLMENPDEQVDGAAIRTNRLVGFPKQVVLLLTAEVLRGHVLQQGRFQIEHGRPGGQTSHQMSGASFQPAGPWAGLGTEASHVKPSSVTGTVLNRAEHVSEQLDRDAEPVG